MEEVQVWGCPSQVSSLLGQSLTVCPFRSGQRGCISPKGANCNSNGSQAARSQLSPLPQTQRARSQDLAQTPKKLKGYAAGEESMNNESPGLKKSCSILVRAHLGTHSLQHTHLLTCSLQAHMVN